MSTTAAVTGGSALWYLSRGTGAVTLVLLTVSVVLGIVTVRRMHSELWPRFVIDGLHRHVSLLVLAVLVVHVLTSILDGYAPIGWLAVVVPFVSSYRPLWLGLGTLALDLLVAVAITSVLRRHLGHRAWRTVHWLAYACWPIALVHGLGTGSDTPVTWMLVLSTLSVVAVLIAAGVRAYSARPANPQVRSAALASVALAPVMLVGFLVWGPLASHWARRAGTPAALIASTQPAAATTTGRDGRIVSSLAAPFRTRVSGSVQQTLTANGDVRVEVDLALGGAGSRRLKVIISGPPSPGGGVAMTASTVTLGTVSSPDLYSGSVQRLNGNALTAHVAAPGGRALILQIDLALTGSGASASGSVTAAAAVAG